MAKVKDFTPDKRNANKGTARGQKQIVNSIQASGVGRSIVTDKNGVIIGGNKSLEAMAEIFGVEAEPIVVKSRGDRPLVHVREDLDLDDPDPNNPARKLAYNDNVTSWLSFELDPEVVSLDMKAGFDFEGIGVSLEELGEMLEGGVEELLKGNGNGNSDGNYVRNIESPEYTPTGDKPDIKNLLDSSKTDNLIAEIDKAQGITDDEKEFLRKAARRHTVFNFKQIAEYYAHSNEKMQELMENSALVIIDFRKAISLGFVQLTNEIAEMVKEEYGDD